MRPIGDLNEEFDAQYESEFEKNGGDNCLGDYSGVSYSSCQQGECDGCIEVKEEARVAFVKTHRLSRCTRCGDINAYCICPNVKPQEKGE